MNNNYSVYIHLFPNGKRYVGITANNPKKRWNYGVGYREQPRVYRAIKKYGWKNIEHIVLFSGLCKEEACQKEIELIKKYNTTSIKNGYNISFGGELGNIGTKRTEKQKKYIRKRCIEERGKKVIHLYLDKNYVIIGHEIFDSIAEASKKTGASKNTISSHCKSHWCQDYFEFGSCPKEWAYYDEFYQEELLSISGDPILYRFLINKGIYEEWFIKFMQGDIDFWKKLTKYNKKVQKSSESQVKKAVI
jgi:hypothetical protein